MRPLTKRTCRELLERIQFLDDDEAVMESAVLFQQSGYRRGAKTIHEAVQKGIKRGSRQVVRELLIALASIDSPVSHRLLLESFLCAEDPELRADCLEAMVYEKKQFDADFVLGCLRDNPEVPVILSALYAFQCKGIAANHQEALGAIVAPLTGHSHPMVRCYALGALGGHPQFKPLVQSFLGDPHPDVAHAARDALFEMTSQD